MEDDDERLSPIEAVLAGRLLTKITAEAEQLHSEAAGRPVTVTDWFGQFVASYAADQAAEHCSRVSA